MTAGHRWGRWRRVWSEMRYRETCLDCGIWRQWPTFRHNPYEYILDRGKTWVREEPPCKEGT